MDAIVIVVEMVGYNNCRRGGSGLEGREGPAASRSWWALPHAHTAGRGWHRAELEKQL